MIWGFYDRSSSEGKIDIAAIHFFIFYIIIWAVQMDKKIIVRLIL